MQNQKDIIIITAAGKSTWLRERFTPSGWARMFGEGLIGGYKEKMQILRDVDERIYKWLGDLKHIVKQMRQAADASRLVDVAILLHALNSRFNQVKEVRNELKQLEQSDIEPFEKEYEGHLPEEDIFSSDDALVSEAGFWSDFKRRWVAEHLENKERKQRKIAVNKLVDASAILADKAEIYLSQMSKARASGKIGEYIGLLDGLAKEQQKFKIEFNPIYNRYLAPVVHKVRQERKEFLDRVNKDEEERLKKLHMEETKSPVLEAQPVAQEVKPTETLKSPVLVPPSSGQISTIPVEPKTDLQSTPPTIPESTADTEKEPVMTINEKDLESGPDTLRSSKALTNVEKIIIKRSHDNFIEELIKASRVNDPYLLSAMLVKYAEQIEDVDLEKSLSLLAIAEGVIDE